MAECDAAGCPSKPATCLHACVQFLAKNDLQRVPLGSMVGKNCMGVAAAASVPWLGPTFPEALLDALFCIAHKKAPRAMDDVSCSERAIPNEFLQNDKATASRQQLNVLREGFAEHGEAGLRAELKKHNISELYGVAAAASIVTDAN